MLLFLLVEASVRGLPAALALWRLTMSEALKTSTWRPSKYKEDKLKGFTAGNIIKFITNLSAQAHISTGLHLSASRLPALLGLMVFVPFLPCFYGFYVLCVSCEHLERTRSRQRISICCWTYAKEIFAELISSELQKPADFCHFWVLPSFSEFWAQRRVAMSTWSRKLLTPDTGGKKTCRELWTQFELKKGMWVQKHNRRTRKIALIVTLFLYIDLQPTCIPKYTRTSRTCL